MSPTTRYLCPLCDWYHDVATPDFSNPDAVHPFVEQDWAPGVDALVAGLAAGQAAVVEAAVKAHLETHPLIEWATALVAARNKPSGLQAPSCRWPACLSEKQQRMLAAQADAGMRGEPTVPMPDQRIVCGCVDGGPEELTREELQNLVDEQGLDLYQARDLLDFVREMCDQRDAAGTPITTADVRGWLGYTGCGGVLVLPDEVVAGLAAMSGTTPDKAATSGDAADIAQQPCGYIRERWDVYPMRDRCVGRAGRAGHAGHAGHAEHGPWEMLS